MTHIFIFFKGFGALLLRVLDLRFIVVDGVFDTLLVQLIVLFELIQIFLLLLLPLVDLSRLLLISHSQVQDLLCSLLSFLYFLPSLVDSKRWLPSVLIFSKEQFSSSAAWHLPQLSYERASTAYRKGYLLPKHRSALPAARGNFRSPLIYFI